MGNLVRTLKSIQIELKGVRRKENLLQAQFLQYAAEGCEFNQTAGGDGPECCHKEQEYAWCGPNDCPLMKLTKIDGG